MIQSSQTQQISECVGNVIVKKRGRKSKKDLEMKENINVKYEENIKNEIIITEKITNEIISNANAVVNIDICDNGDADEILNIEEEKPLAKKRGRKPKGGKIIHQIVPLNNNKDDKPNVILHLKLNKKLFCLLEKKTKLRGFCLRCFSVAFCFHGGNLESALL